MADQPPVKYGLSQAERVQIMKALGSIVQKTGEYVLSTKPEMIIDTVEARGHQFSTIDAQAGTFLHSLADSLLKQFSCTFLEESQAQRSIDQTNISYPVLIFDAIEGSTNAKRGLTGLNGRPILAGTSAMFLESEALASIAGSAFYDYASRTVYTSVRTGTGEFMAFIGDCQLLTQEEVLQMRGDSQYYAVVPRYSHDNIQQHAQLEEALNRAGIRTTGGTRSSAQDLLDLLHNEADAYVDLRSLFAGNTNSRDENLHPWDVGGLLPLMDAVGFHVTDAHGQDWQKIPFHQSLALVVTRPILFPKIMEAISSLPFACPRVPEDHNVSVPLPSPNLLRAQGG